MAIDEAERIFRLKNVQWASVRYTDTKSNMLRLDAGAYCTEAKTWLASLSKRCTRRLKELADVRQPIVFGKRFMLGTRVSGIPVYSSSEMVMTTPEVAFFLSNEHERAIDDLSVKDGWILVSRTGTVGNVLLVSPDRDGFAVDDHMIRVIPLDPKHTGLLLTFLSSLPGQEIIKGLAYGAVQKVIKGFQIEDVMVPVLSDQSLNSLNMRTSEAAACRAAASLVMGTIQEILHRAIGLPPLTEKCTKRLDPGRGIDSTLIQSSEVTHMNGGRSEYRLDAHFYNPLAQLAIANIKASPCEVKSVVDVTERVMMGPRFKRNYVESDYGTPFLSGKNIVQMRPTDIKYLSNLQMAEADELLLRRGWTLLTRSGTIGRTCFVWENYEDYAASEHILRVIPKESEIDPGYLYAFLSSRYGYEQILRYRHGSVIDEITDKQVERVLVPCPSRKAQTAIGDLVRQAYEKRAEAIRLEDEAQIILMNELTSAKSTKEV